MILSLRDDALAKRDCDILRRYHVPCLEAPVHRTEPLAFDRHMLAQADGFILTSQQAAYALPNSDERGGKKRPVFTVGRASAKSAKERGYDTVIWGPSDAVALADVIKRHVQDPSFVPHPRLCWLRATRISTDIIPLLQQAEIAAEQAIVYRMQEVDALPQKVQTALAAGEVTAIMALSKAQYLALKDKLQHHQLCHHKQTITLYVVSQAVADAAQDDGWHNIIISRRKRALSVQAAVIYDWHKAKASSQ